MVSVHLVAAAAGGSYYLALYWNALRGNSLAGDERQVEKNADKREPSDRYPAVGGHETNSLSRAKQ
jgi:hypothetical protein